MFLLAPAGPLLGQTRIMCLGDSITEGTNGWASYRYPLWFGLKAEGYNFDFVGPWSDRHACGTPNQCFNPLYSSTFDRDHAGYCGWRTDEVAPYVAAITGAAEPDIVLIHLGTNDLNDFELEGIDNADAYLQGIIAEIRSVCPNAKILLAQIIPMAPRYRGSGYVSALNKRIAAIALDMGTPQSPVILVDQLTGYDLTSMMQADGLHPNTAGEERMADVWQRAIAEALGQEPHCNEGAPGQPPNSLLALYTFDSGSAIDVIPASNRTCAVGGTPQFSLPGFEGLGMSLNGTSALVADVLLGPAARPQLTMGGWVYLYAGQDRATLLSQNVGTDNLYRTLAIDSRGGGLGWSAFAGAGGGVDGSGVLGFIPVVASQWQFVSVVYDADKQSVMLYVDGETRPGSGNPGEGRLVPWLGTRPCGGSPECTLRGIVDNVFVMSEALEALRLDEIRLGGYHRIPTCPVIISQAECVEACPGSNVKFTIDAAGSEHVQPIEFQWRKDGEDLANDANIEGATSPVVSLSGVSMSDAGSYECVVSNGCGSIVSDPVTLSVFEVTYGDSDKDCDVDLLDLAAFVRCMQGPLVSFIGGCTAFDWDANDRIDLFDFSAFQVRIGGSRKGGRSPVFPE